MGKYLPRGFESLLLRFATRPAAGSLAITGETMFPPWALFFALQASRCCSTRERGLGCCAGFAARERRGRDLNPRRTFRHVRDFQSRSLDRSDTSPSRASFPALRRGRDLNPRRTQRPETVFETAAFDRSATPPTLRGDRLPLAVLRSGESLGRRRRTGQCLDARPVRWSRASGASGTGGRLRRPQVPRPRRRRRDSNPRGRDSPHLTP